ncbi:restriction endonuclease subunit S [Quisquiliibacterium transsilvanicum]|nr:restriction endonuclease subunit S [Quisquiliibacterium transsilvanicum]
MGELFGHPRLRDVPMKRLVLSESEIRKSSLRQGDLLFARRSLVAEGAGRCSVVKQLSEPTTFESSIIRARPDPRKADSDYLYYYFASPQGRELMRTILRQVAVSGIAGSDLAELRIPLPPIVAQRACSAFLALLDDRLDLLRQTNATLESIAEALFKSWFIDFDPVRAKAEGREPEGMDAETAALFPEGFEESELGLIPRGWRWGSLSTFADLNARSWTARRAPSEVAYIDLAGVKANLFDPPQHYTFLEAPSRARRELRVGDTLVGTVRPGNRSFGFIAQAEQGLTGSTGFAVLSPRNPEAAAFTYLCATRDANIERLAALADGGAYPAVRPDLVQQTECVVPTAAVLAVFASLAQPLLNAVAANAARAVSLGEVRDALLPRLVSGRLRLADMAEAHEAAAA